MDFEFAVVVPEGVDFIVVDPREIFFVVVDPDVGLAAIGPEEVAFAAEDPKDAADFAGVDPEGLGVTVVVVAAAEGGGGVAGAAVPCLRAAAPGETALPLVVVVGAAVVPAGFAVSVAGGLAPVTLT